MTTISEPKPRHPLRAAWTAAHAPVTGVPRWARIAAYAIPLAVLPSSIWRIAVCTFGAPIADVSIAGGQGNLPSWLPLAAFVILLSITSELLAFTAVGLVSAWGEVIPRWIPGLRGRKVPALAAVIPAALGAAVLTMLCTWFAISHALGLTIQGHALTANAILNFDDWKGVLAVMAYAPLLLWGPLLGVVTVAYWRRRNDSRLKPR